MLTDRHCMVSAAFHFSMRHPAAIKILFFLLSISSVNAQQSALMNNNIMLQSDFNPTDLEAKVEFWFDNTDVSSLTIVNTDEVKIQTSKFGSLTRKANTDTNGSRPNYDAATNEIFFDGTADALRLVGTMSATAKAGGEVFIVERRHPTYTGVPELFAVSDTTTSSRFCLLRDRANDGTVTNRTIGMQYINGATNNVLRGNVNSISDKVNIFNYRIDPQVSYTMDFDDRGGIGETATTGSDNGRWIDDLTASNKVMFGMRNNGATTFFSSYYEMEFIYFHTELTATQRLQMYNYLNAKYHAYSNQATTNIGVVLAGQSNAEGKAADSERPARLTTMTGVLAIQVWTASATFSQYGSSNDGGDDFGLDLSLLTSLAEYYKNGDVYMSKEAVAGSPVAAETGQQDWNLSTAELYPNLRDKSLDLQTALDALGTNIIFLVWVQGERDARAVGGGEPAAYEANLNDVLDELVTDGFTPDYYIINRLHDDLTSSTALPAITAPNLATVQAAQEAVVAARANSYILDMSLFEIDPVDFTHFVGEEYLKMGSYILNNILRQNLLIP